MPLPHTGAKETPASRLPAGVVQIEIHGSAGRLPQMGNPVLLRRKRRQLNDAAFHVLVFVAFQRRQSHLGFARVGAMHCLAVVAERLLRESLWIAAHFRPLRPSITVTMQGDADDPQTGAAASEFLPPILFLDQSEPRE